MRYVLPQVIQSKEQDVSLFLRVTQPFKNVRFVVSDGKNTLATVTRPKAAPGEMEKITLLADKLQNAGETITVSLEVLE